MVACNDDCSGLPDSGTLCFPVLGEFDGKMAWFVGVAPWTLMLGGVGLVGVVGCVLEGPASSVFFPPATEAIPACRDVTREAGGGLFNRGEAGHCGVVSPEVGPALFAPARAGNLDTASDTAPPPPDS